MDPLRQDIKRLMDSCNSIILEKDDLVEILDGRVDGVIAKHRGEDEVFSQVIVTDKPSVKPKEDMADNGVIDTQQYTLVMAEQIIRSFKNEYDEQAIQNVEDMRKKKSKKARRIVTDYDETLAIVNQLKKQFNLE